MIKSSIMTSCRSFDFYTSSDHYYKFDFFLYIEKVMYWSILWTKNWIVNWGLVNFISKNLLNWRFTHVSNSLTPIFLNAATQTNNMKNPIATDLGSVATPYDYGAGEITYEPFQFPTRASFWKQHYWFLNYLCYIGFNTTRLSQKLSLIVSAATGILLLIMIPISTTITISNFIVKRSVKVSRTVTNVDDEDKIGLLCLPSSMLPTGWLSDWF